MELILKDFSTGYSKNKVVNKINFKLRGFDRDPITSLIIEAKKIKDVNGKKVEKFFNESNQNYNIYSKSLLSEKNFKNKLLKKKIIF